MTTIIWVGLIYLATVAISFPILLAYYNKSNDKDESLDLQPRIKAMVVSFIPVYNIRKTLNAIIYWYLLKKATSKLEKHFQNHKDKGVRDQIMGIVKQLKDYNKLTENKEE